MCACVILRTEYRPEKSLFVFRNPSSSLEITSEPVDLRKQHTLNRTDVAILALLFEQLHELLSRSRFHTDQLQISLYVRHLAHPDERSR